MSEIYSVGHVTANELGLEELSVEYHPTLMQSLFRKPGTKKIWVRAGGQWHRKGEKKPVDNHIELGEISDLLMTVKINKLLLEQ